MEGCYLHNPATPPGCAEPSEAPARPRARLARGAAAPEITCLSPTLFGSLRDRIWKGPDLRIKKKKHINLLC